MQHAACVGAGVEHFVNHSRRPDALVVACCGRCDHAEVCLAYALAHGAVGWWGGYLLSKGGKVMATLADHRPVEIEVKRVRS